MREDISDSIRWTFKVFDGDVVLLEVFNPASLALREKRLRLQPFEGLVVGFCSNRATVYVRSSEFGEFYKSKKFFFVDAIVELSAREFS